MHIPPRGCASQQAGRLWNKTSVTMRQNEPFFLMGVCRGIYSQGRKAKRGTVFVSESAAQGKNSVWVCGGTEAHTAPSLLQSVPHDSQQVLSSVLTIALSGKCDEEILHLLLTFPKSEKSWFATRELCSLPGSQVFSLLVAMCQNLNLRNFIYKVRTVPIRALLRRLC